MLQLILDIAGRLIDLFVADQRRRDEWKRRVAEAVRSETSARDSSEAHDDFDELEKRVREGRHDGIE